MGFLKSERGPKGSVAQPLLAVQSNRAQARVPVPRRPFPAFFHKFATRSLLCFGFYVI
jgi:hypothetical protein